MPHECKAGIDKMRAVPSNTMDDSYEQHFVQTFIRKERRERLLFELTTPKKRYAGVSRFCHQAGEFLDPAKIVMSGEDLDRETAFAKFVQAHDELCLVLSPDFFTDEQFLPLKDAVRQAVMCFDAVLIIGKSFAVVFGEVMKGGRGKYLLSDSKLD